MNNMITYNFGIECKMSWEDFLSLKTLDGKTLYKSDFKTFSDLYEFIDRSKTEISELLFDGVKYILEDGLLHNLYGPARIRCADKDTPFYVVGTILYRFFINGKEVQCEKKHCSKIENFEEKELYFYEEITGRKSQPDPVTGKWYRRKEGIDYKHHIIDLEQLRNLDKRKKKLERICRK